MMEPRLKLKLKCTMFLRQTNHELSMLECCIWQQDDGNQKFHVTN